MSLFDQMPGLADFATTAHWLSQRGWSEGAGGNMSVRLDENFDGKPGEYIALPLHVPHLAGMSLMFTGSGTRARETALHPARDIGVYHISEDGKSYAWMAGNQNPTSELPAHCAIHNAWPSTALTTRRSCTPTPANLISLCHDPKLGDGASVSNKILRLQSEALLHLPEGIGYVPHQIPGSLDLGVASAKLVDKHRLVLWYMHGCLATGKDLATAFDYMEVFEKCADMYWTLRAAGIDPVGMPDEDIEKRLPSLDALNATNLSANDRLAPERVSNHQGRINRK